MTPEEEEALRLLAIEKSRSGVNPLAMPPNVRALINANNNRRMPGEAPSTPAAPVAQAPQPYKPPYAAAFDEPNTPNVPTQAPKPLSVMAFARQAPSAPPSASFKSQGGVDMAKVMSPSGRYFSVAQEHAPRFQGFLSDLEKAGYPIHQDQSGGYNYRNIAGSNKLSNHATGSAIDINWSLNPRNGSLGHIGETLGADRVREIASRHGLRWGGDYKNPDAMHFEVHGPLDAKANVLRSQPNAFSAPSSITPGAMSMPATQTEVMADKESGGSLTLPNFKYPGSPEAGWMVQHNPTSVPPAEPSPFAPPMALGGQPKNTFGNAFSFAPATWSDGNSRVTWSDGTSNAFGPLW